MSLIVKVKNGSAVMDTLTTQNQNHEIKTVKGTN